MKTIIVLTDFSKNAFHAASYAVQLAQHLGYKVLLMHAYELPVPVTEYEVDRVHFNAMIGKLEDRLKLKRERLLQKTGATIPIEFVTVDNDLIGHITEFYEKPDVVLSVIGLTGADMINYFLGSNTLKIVNHVSRTILTIPPFTPYKTIRKIVFTVNLAIDLKHLPVERLKRLLTVLPAKLLILNLSGKKNSDEEEQKMQMQLAEMMQDVPYSLHTLYGQGLAENINQFCKNENADMLAIIPRENGFIENLLGENQTKKILFRSGIPILTLPRS